MGVSLSASDIANVLAHYGLQASPYSELSHGLANVSYLIDVGRDQFILTMALEKSLSEMTSLVELLEMLEQAHFPATRVLPDLNHKKIINWQGRPVFLKAYVAGRVVLDLTEAMLFQAGALLGGLHHLKPLQGLPDKHAYGVE